MDFLRAALRELTGLFVDDGSLALQLASVILVAGTLSTLLPHFSWVAGVALLCGSLGTLFVNVTRTSRSNG